MSNDAALEWSVYEDEWPMPRHADAPARPEQQQQLPPFTAPLRGATLRHGGLRKTAMLRRGAQGAVYAAVDTANAQHNSDDDDHDTDGGSSRGGGGHDGVVCAVKRLFTQQSDFGRRGIAETVLREATLLRHVNACERAQCRRGGGAVAGDDDDNKNNDDGNKKDSTRDVDRSVGVVRLYRIVEAPHRELCLVLQYCPLDLQRIALPRRASARALPRLLQQLQPMQHRHARQHGADADDHDDDKATTTTTTNVSPAHARCPLLAQLPLVRYLLRRLLRVVLFLHDDCHVLHRDVKLSNFLVTAAGDVRLSDFGSARLRTTPHTPHVARAHTPASLRTTLLYQPPEALLGDCHYDTAYDVWSLGVVFAELLLQRHLFARANSELALLGDIWRLLGPPPQQQQHADDKDDGGDRRAHDTDAASSTLACGTLRHKFTRDVVSDEGYDLLRRMLCVLPAQRITLRAALQHPFLCNVDDDDDATGRALWLCKVADVLRRERADSDGVIDDDDDDEDDTRAYGVAHARRVGAATRSLYMHTNDNDDDDDDDDDGDLRSARARRACELVSPVYSDTDAPMCACTMPPPPPTELTRSP